MVAGGRGASALPDVDESGHWPPFMFPACPALHFATPFLPLLRWPGKLFVKAAWEHLLLKFKVIFLSAHWAWQDYPHTLLLPSSFINTCVFNAFFLKIAHPTILHGSRGYFLFSSTSSGPRIMTLHCNNFVKCDWMNGYISTWLLHRRFHRADEATSTISFAGDWNNDYRAEILEGREWFEILILNQNWKKYAPWTLRSLQIESLEWQRLCLAKVCIKLSDISDNRLFF